MAWQFQDDMPIYSQLVTQLQLRMVTGVFSPGERLPSVRDLAAEAGVNPNTMQRAMAELERQGLVHSQRTAGRFVTEETERLTALKEELARTQVRSFLEGMQKLGFPMEEILALVQGEGSRDGSLTNTNTEGEN